MFSLIDPRHVGCLELLPLHFTRIGQKLEAERETVIARESKLRRPWRGREGGRLNNVEIVKEKEEMGSEQERETKREA